MSTLPPDASLDSLREIARPILDCVPGLHFVLLFGSEARGDGGPDSDLDFAFDADEGQEIDRIRLAVDLERAFGRSVDVVDLRHDPGYVLRRFLLRDGRIFYQRVPGSVAWWRSAAIEQNESFRPAYERMRDAQLHWLAGGA